jgi:3-oxoacyl-[acyl-carrier-protein] synthase II
LYYVSGGCLWQGEPTGIWERSASGGGLALASMSAFLVLEAREHAEKRGAKPLARISHVESERTRRRDGDINAALTQMWAKLPLGPDAAVISGASGLEPATSAERAFLEAQPGLAVRATGTHLGHGLEAQFVMNVALAAIAAKHGALFPSTDHSGLEHGRDGPLRQVVVTSIGHWRGEGLALIEAV